MESSSFLFLYLSFHSCFLLFLSVWLHDLSVIVHGSLHFMPVNYQSLNYYICVTNMRKILMKNQVPSRWVKHWCSALVFFFFQYESAIDIHGSPSSWTPHPKPFPPFPSMLAQSTDFGCPPSCIELALALCVTYGNIRVSVLFSQAQVRYFMDWIMPPQNLQVKF